MHHFGRGQQIVVAFYKYRNENSGSLKGGNF